MTGEPPDTSRGALDRGLDDTGDRVRPGAAPP
ncbi:hypothetical protein FraQA3DRAFT_0590, partial [Frankia sp. QA3]